MGNGYYATHTQGLKRELADTLDRDELRELHRRRPGLHFLVAARHFGTGAAAAAGIVLLRDSWWWIPCAAVVGLTVFNCTVLLHEVLHGLVFGRNRPGLSRALGWLYSVPSGISASQFTRWHLDHHAQLGSAQDDPKRHYLSPKRNKPWFKALYFTPALFPIYFRAAARETASYPVPLRRQIAGERAVAILFHLLLAATVGLAAGWALLAKVYLVPVFLVFPVAFALNRLGQHYDINPADPAQWSTLMEPSRVWGFVYLWSNYHLEHHYYPGVPFYNLPRLRRLLDPYFHNKGMRPRSYSELLYGFLILNRKPHTDWTVGGSARPRPNELQPGVTGKSAG